MKILTDFDGVLTDIESEALRVGMVFEERLFNLPVDRSETESLLTQIFENIKNNPEAHGWRWGNRITAFANEDYFIRVNALADSLDRLVGSSTIAQKLKIELLKIGLPSFTALGTLAYQTVIEETMGGKHHPIDDSALAFLDTAICNEVEVVVVSNSSTERIEKMLAPYVALNPTLKKIRIRGGAKKFELGDTPNTEKYQSYVIDKNRPAYDKILREELPDIVFGDVFSLDLALPIALSKSSARKMKVFLRKRSYTPLWALENFHEQVNRGGVSGDSFDGFRSDFFERLF